MSRDFPLMDVCLGEYVYGYATNQPQSLFWTGQRTGTVKGFRWTYIPGLTALMSSRLPAGINAAGLCLGTGLNQHSRNRLSAYSVQNSFWVLSRKFFCLADNLFAFVSLTWCLIAHLFYFFVDLC